MKIYFKEKMRSTKEELAHGGRADFAVELLEGDKDEEEHAVVGLN